MKDNFSKEKEVETETDDRKEVTIRNEMDRLGDSLGIPKGDYQTWSKYSVVDLIRVGGQDIAKKFGYQLLSLLREAYPEHMWKNHDFLNDLGPTQIAKIREEIIKLGVKLGIKTGDYFSWYKVPFRKIHSIISHFNVLLYSYSRFHILSTVFPEHKWHPFLFKGSHKRRIKGEITDANRREFREFLEKALAITKPDDWYNVTRADLAPLPLRHFRNQYSFIQFLQQFYPERLWDAEKMAWSSLGWSLLESLLRDIFAKYKIDVRVESMHIRMILIPELKLCFEYQPPIKYAMEIITNARVFQKKPSDLASSIADKDGLTLITIPFWWNRVRSSLLAEIYAFRADLFQPGEPLAEYRSTAWSSNSIPNKILRESQKLNKGYLRYYSEDHRFSHMFNLKREDDVVNPRKKLKSRILKKEPNLRSTLKRQKLRSKKVPQRRLPLEQRLALEESFQTEPSPNQHHLELLAAEFILPFSRIRNWFVTRRLQQGAQKLIQ